MWTVVYMARGKSLVEKIKNILTNNNIIVMVRPVDKTQENDDNCCYEVLVPQTEVTMAQDLIIDQEIN